MKIQAENLLGKLTAEFETKLDVARNRSIDGIHKCSSFDDQDASSSFQRRHSGNQIKSHQFYLQTIAGPSVKSSYDRILPYKKPERKNDLSLLALKVLSIDGNYQNVEIDVLDRRRIQMACSS